MIDDKIVKPLLNWYAAQARILPWRENQDPYRVWVSEIMLQQTRVEAVIPYFNRFMEQLPTIEALADAKEEQLHKLWEGLGYYSRVRNLQKAAQVICDQHQGRFPEKYEEILELPGIGPYTAGAVSSIAFNQPRAAVDGNVLRVMTRVLADNTDIASAAFKKKLGEDLEKIYPKDACGAFTQSLIELGAIICVPNGAPLCNECPISSMCSAFQQGTQLQFPVKQPKKKRRIQHMTVFLLEYENQIAICKRPEEGLLAGLWQFPNVEGILSVQQVMNWVRAQNIAVSRMDEIIEDSEKKHIFTHIEWHMHVFRIQCENHMKPNRIHEQEASYDSGAAEYGELRWISKQELKKKVALPTAFRKLL